MSLFTVKRNFRGDNNSFENCPTLNFPSTFVSVRHVNMLSNSIAKPVPDNK